jgi:FAD/FMN-containing dehydrogenase
MEPVATAPVRPPDETSRVRRHADTSHDQVVAEIAAQIRERAARRESVHIQKGGVHHFVPLARDRRFAGGAIDVSRLNRVLEIDASRQRCVAEPGVTFGELVRATLAHGLIPTVVPELEGITAGGAVAGCSVESMSWRYGGFHDSCAEYELVSGAGEVLTVSPRHEPALFHMIHGSYGTLAILTRLSFALVPAKPYVRLEYRKFSTVEAFEAELRACIAAGDHPFIDAIAHAPDELVLCLGTFADAAPYISDYRWLDIYYKSTRTRREDYLTTEDYCFRYDTECHWLTRTVPPLEWKAVRFAVGKLFLGSTNLIRWSKRLESLLAVKKRPDVVVDVFVPSRRLRDFFAWYTRGLAFYPLWLVPYRIAAPYPWIAPTHAAGFADELFIDCAVYGKRNADPDIDWSQALEAKTYELGGIKTLISRNHHTVEQFWQIYNQPAYEAAKSRLDPHGVFPPLYEKFHHT